MVGCWSQLSPTRTVVTSFTTRTRHGSIASPTSTNHTNNGIVVNDKYYNGFEEGDWALCLAAPKHHERGNTVACALSNGDIQVYDQQRLHQLVSYTNNPLITDLTYGPENCLLATGDDGTMAIYDTRQNPSTSPAAIKSRIPAGQSALSVSLGFDGYIAAVAASKGRIHFVDLRASASTLGTYVDSHTDDVTCVQFHPSRPSILLSASADGLACVFDTTQPTEEAALSTVLNTGTPIRRAGFCGDSRSAEGAIATVWCLTGSETASLWNAETGTCVHDFGMSLRDNLAQTLGGGRRVDYLIDAVWLSDSRELLLSAGNAIGDAALYRLETSNTACCWQPCHWMTGGHKGVVRSSCLLSQSTFLTGGEDARLCEWNRMTPQAHAAGGSPTNKRGTLSSMIVSNTSSTSFSSCKVFAANGGGGGGVSSSAAATNNTATQQHHVVVGGGPIRRRPRNRPSKGTPY